ncbi:uncharacterized protein LOC129957521 [Argiope bruennichi]|uniref:uncharacterized protein LOC129957521 n=1 Tax=Argiope bruennichi TaxID=94029 RepID=UPI002494C11A|nr:uncharacterized protein LOC129957521 [Argiope bruennichi]XP_055925834.1 uncharacterized protein LOC129957521 [Argiope bruennichi]
MEQRPMIYKRLSLQEMALRTALVDIWNKTVDLLSDENFRCRLYYAPCKKVNTNVENKINEIIEGMVKDNVLKLMIPAPLKKRMMLLVRPIGTELLNWQKFHKGILKHSCNTFYIPLLHHLCWQSAGLIAYGDTAERLVHLESLDVEKRYQFACTYCLVDYIPNLWEKLSEETRERFYGQLSVSPWRQVQLESYWAYVLKGEESKLDSIVSRRFEEGFSFNRYAFEGVARKGNRTAAEYFFQKLTDEEKRNSVRDTTKFILKIGRPNATRMNCDAPKEKLSDVMFYIFSQMRDEERLELMIRFPAETLVCYFDWPWQDALLDHAAIIWEFLTGIQCFRLVNEINQHIEDSGYYLPDLLQQFFLRSPDRFRTDFVCYECEISGFYGDPGILSKLFEAEDKETIGVIFGAIDVEDRRKLVSTYRFYEIFEGLIEKNKWQLIELCLQKASFTGESKEELKKTYRRFLDRAMPNKKPGLDKFFEFLDKMEKNTSNKRSSEEETELKSKKRCCEKRENDLH